MMARLARAAAARGNSFMSWYAVFIPNCILALGSSSVNPFIQQQDYQVVIRQTVPDCGIEIGSVYSGIQGRRAYIPFFVRSKFDGVDRHVVADQLKVVDRGPLIQCL